MEQFDIWRLLAGIGIFLFGMYLLEEAIRQLSGRAFRSFLRRSTDSNVKSVMAGTFATAILQSSSAVSLMVLAFVGAGVMALESAVGMIIGSNLGTTLTAWIIASLGFKIKIEAFALPLVAIGGLGLMLLSRWVRLQHISKMLLGFGFLFLGLDYLKTSVDFLAGSLDISAFPNLGMFTFLLVGFLLTAVVQSSSAAMAIALAGVHAGVITFPQAAIMVIGINLGTTLTILLGALNAVPIKKQVALSHFLFNIISGAVALALLPFLVRLIQMLLPVEQEPVVAVALFHTIFNLLGVLLFLPFVKPFARLLRRFFPEVTPKLALYVNTLASMETEAGLTALGSEVQHLLLRALQHNLLVLQLPIKLLPDASQASPDFYPQLPRGQSPAVLYSQLKMLQEEIIAFAAQLQVQQMPTDEVELLNRYLHAVRAGVQAAKLLKDVQHEYDRLGSEEDATLLAQYKFLLQEHSHFSPQLAGLIAVTETDMLITGLVELSARIQADDQQFLNTLTQMVRDRSVNPTYISTLLNANRGLVFPVRQLIRALIDLKIPAAQQHVFEHLEDYRKAAEVVE